MKSDSPNQKPEYNFDYSKAKPNRFASKNEDNSISDLQKYIEERVANDPEFAKEFEKCFADLKRTNSD